MRRAEIPAEQQLGGRLLPSVYVSRRIPPPRGISSVRAAATGIRRFLAPKVLRLINSSAHNQIGWKDRPKPEISPCSAQRDMVGPAEELNRCGI